MATSIFGAIAILGGTSGAMDSILTATIADGDICFVINSSEEFLTYRYESSSAVGEVNPTTIIPDDNLTGTGEWVLLDSKTDALTVLGAAAMTGLITATGGITMGDSAKLTWDIIPGTDHYATGEQASFTAGENLVYGNVCYFKSDGKMWKADADASTTMPVMAMALATILADAEGNFLLRGFVRDDTYTNTVGGYIFASTTAGGITQTSPTGAGDQIQKIGIATHADRIYFNPELTIVEYSA